MKSLFLRGVAVPLILVLGAVCVRSADAPKKGVKGGGRLVIEKDVQDAGDVVRGKEAKTTFVLKNTGPGTLRILSAKPSCGCTVASFDEKIEPGQQGKVSAAVKTDNFRGAIEKSIIVTSDDPEAETRELRIKANVVGSIVLLPRPGLALPSGLAWEYKGKLIVRKDPTETGSLEIQDIHSSASWVVAKAHKVTTEEPSGEGIPEALPGDWVLEIGVTDDAKGKPAPGQAVKFKTGLPREPEVSVPISVNFLEAMRIIPSPLLLPLPSDGESRSAGTVTALVRPGLGKEKFQATASPDAFAVKVEPDGPRKYRATVTWKSGSDAPKDGTIRFQVGEGNTTLPVHVGDAKALFQGARQNGMAKPAGGAHP